MSAQQKYNVWVELQDGTTEKVKLAGTYNLNLAETDWLYGQYLDGRFKGYRKRALKTPLTLQERAWREAKRCVGVMENPGHNNTGTHGVVTVNEIILEDGGHLGDSWCGFFDAHCYRVAGAKSVDSAWGGVRYLGYIAGTRNIAINQLELGDLLAYDFNGETNAHTGLFGFWCDASGTPTAEHGATHVYAIEGNTGLVGAVSDTKTGGDGVREKIRPRSEVQRAIRVLR